MDVTLGREPGRRRAFDQISEQSVEGGGRDGVPHSRAAGPWIEARGRFGRRARVPVMSDADPHPLAPDAPADGGPVRTHLGWAAVVSAFCFLPIGLVALGYSLASARALAAGDAERARRRARVARRWIVVTVVVGLIVDAALLAVLAVLGAFSS